jgi:DNA ligase-1
MSILEILNQVAATTKKTEKEAILKENAKNETLQRVFYLAYQPTINFFMKKIPPIMPKSGAGSVFEEEAFTLDHALANLVEVISKRKLTGNAAIGYVGNLLAQLSADDAEVLARVIGRDLRIDCGASTANKVWKGLILDVPYMRCSLPKEVDLKAFPWVQGLFSQLKSDGSFTNVNYYADGAVEFMTRNGNVYPNDEFGEVVAAVQRVPAQAHQFHGELLILGPDGNVLERAEGNGILNKLQKGGKLPEGHKIKFVAWDMIPLDEARPKNKYEVPYRVRLATLEQLGLSGAIEVVETRVVHSIREAYEHYQEMLALGLEGTILKHPDAIWEDTTSKKQVKFKLDVTVDLEIIGFTAGKGKNANTFGAIMMRSSDGQLTVNCSGMKDDLRKHISENRDDYLNTIAAVTSNAMTKVRKDGTRSLFLPRLTELRNDKNEADSLEKVVLQFESAVTDLEKLLA